MTFFRYVSRANSQLTSLIVNLVYAIYSGAVLALFSLIEIWYTYCALTSLVGGQLNYEISVWFLQGGKSK